MASLPYSTCETVETITLGFWFGSAERGWNHFCAKARFSSSKIACFSSAPENAKRRGKWIQWKDLWEDFKSEKKLCVYVHCMHLCMIVLYHINTSYNYILWAYHICLSCYCPKTSRTKESCQQVEDNTHRLLKDSNVFLQERGSTPSQRFRPPGPVFAIHSRRWGADNLWIDMKLLKSNLKVSQCPPAKMIFLFHGWDMLVPRRVTILEHDGISQTLMNLGYFLFLLVMVAVPFSKYCRMLVNCQPYHPNLQTYSSWAVEIGHNGLAKGGVFEKRPHFWGRTEAPPDRRHGTLQPLDLSKLRGIETSWEICLQFIIVVWMKKLDFQRETSRKAVMI